MTTKFYIISGEASGDLHGSNLIKAIKTIDSNTEFRAWGGDLMQNNGATIVKHYKELAFMGFKEVLQNIRTIKKNFNFCYADIEKYKPDCVILIDYPGFNLRVAKYLKQRNYKIYYYISPQVWAWKQSRVKKIKQYIDKMFVILPFEKDFYAKFNYKVDFVGHPLLDVITEHLKNKTIFEKFIDNHKLENKKIIAILPGSRKQEIKHKLPVMLSVVKYFNDYQFVIAAAPSIELDYYKEFTKNINVKIISGKTYELLQHSTAAIVTSGTATLETALFEIPEIVCYKAGNLSYQLAKRLIKVKYISLVNLIMNKQVVKELIQSNLNTHNLKTELENILTNSNYRKNISEDYKKLKQILGGKGASVKTAELILKYLKDA